MRPRLPVVLRGLVAGLLAASLAAPMSASPAGAAEPRRTTVMQLNLCLSGMAKCYDRRKSSKLLRETVRAIRSVNPDAVLVNEACSGDVRRVAKRMDLHLTFAVVRRSGKAMQCKDPGGRGVFGNAILTRKAAVPVRNRAYRVQSERYEERRVDCAKTKGVTYCVTHLSARDTRKGRRVNDLQCNGFARVMKNARGSQPVVGAGDFNRREGCRPRGLRYFDDIAATQMRGIQHVVADRRLGATTRSWIIPMRHTDHDTLVVRLRR